MGTASTGKHTLRAHFRHSTTKNSKRSPMWERYRLAMRPQQAGEFGTGWHHAKASPARQRVSFPLVTAEAYRRGQEQEVPPLEVSEHDRAQHGRQRRFLIVISLVLLAKYALTIELGTKIQLLGMEFDIQRKEVLVFAGWVMWAWALIRFAQFHRVVAKPAIQVVYAHELHLAALKYPMRDAQGLIDRGLAENGVRVTGRVFDIHMPSRFEKGRQEAGWYQDADTEYRVLDDGGRGYRDIIAMVRLKSGGEMDVRVDPNISGSRMRRARFWAWIRCIVRTHAFSDYYAPFFIAVMPAIAAALHYAGLA
jgi:hypothetical protein